MGRNAIYTAEERRRRKNDYIMEYNKKKYAENPEIRKEYFHEYYMRKKEKQLQENKNLY